jgi:hypothetical protein
VTYEVPKAVYKVIVFGDVKRCSLADINVSVAPISSIFWVEKRAERVNYSEKFFFV